MLYIMRHGRTVWNMEHKLQGKTDVPLSEAGRPVVEQAAAACRETDLYLQALAMVNNAVAAKADAVCRVVCGLPVYYKGGERP